MKFLSLSFLISKTEVIILIPHIVQGGFEHQMISCMANAESSCQVKSIRIYEMPTMLQAFC